MQYIANSLSTPLHAFTAGNVAQGAAASRWSLPAISQEQWDRCAELNTEQVVSQIKDLLSEYSISQRLFGEHVLGLSQGSVSDLLAQTQGLADVDSERSRAVR